MCFAFCFHAGITDLRYSQVNYLGAPHQPCFVSSSLAFSWWLWSAVLRSKEPTPQSVNCVFSSLLFQMEIMWIFQHNTGTCTTAGRPPGLSSCPVSEHKLIASCSTCSSETLICHEYKQISCLGFSLISSTKRMMTHISLVEKISDDWEMTSKFLLLLRKRFS